LVTTDNAAVQRSQKPAPSLSSMHCSVVAIELKEWQVKDKGVSNTYVACAVKNLSEGESSRLATPPRKGDWIGAVA
jgi:hypothetical protein